MSFDEIRGQERAIKILRQTIANDHLAQAYLFHGPDGVGKKKTAMAFAKALNCDTHSEDACGHCLSCRKISEGIHPDVTLLQQEKGEIKIGAIREIISGMIYRPLEARKRVVIIDEADKCNLQASNAFLKTLEEPPVETVIILVSSNPDLLPQTVLSRCRRVSFSSIPARIIADILVQKNGLAPSAAENAAYLADGSIGKAIALASTDVQQVRGDILEGLAGREAAPGIFFDLAERYSKDEGLFYDALYWFSTYFRDILILKSGGELTLIINKDLHASLSEIGDKISEEGLLEILNFIQSIYKGQERNMNRQLALDVLGTKIMEALALKKCPSAASGLRI